MEISSRLERYRVLGNRGARQPGRQLPSTTHATDTAVGSQVNPSLWTRTPLHPPGDKLRTWDSIRQFPLARERVPAQQVATTRTAKHVILGVYQSNLAVLV